MIEQHFCTGYERLYKEACERLQEQGGEPVSIDFAPFATAAGMLYTSAFLAERYAGIRAFLESKVLIYAGLISGLLLGMPLCLPLGAAICKRKRSVKPA